MGRYNEIVGCLDSKPENFEPIFMEGPEDEVIASDWAAGFLDAVSLRPKAWEPLFTHGRAGIMIMPILLLNGDAEINAGTDSAVDKEVFLAEVPDIIPACVAVSTSSGRTAGPIASNCQGGIEAAAEVAGAIDMTAHTDRQQGRSGRRSHGEGGLCPLGGNPSLNRNLALAPLNALPWPESGMSVADQARPVSGRGGIGSRWPRPDDPGYHRHA